MFDPEKHEITARYVHQGEDLRSQDRLPVETIVTEYDERLIRDAVRRGAPGRAAVDKLAVCIL